jgi:diguanylate cyclase (GGDEF)-like protein
MPLRKEDREIVIEKAYLCNVPGEDSIIELKRNRRYVLGRHGNADVVLPNNTVSREHARIEWDGGHFFIADLGAINGTFVNKVQVRRGPLLDGDMITIGPFDITYHTEMPIREIQGNASTWRILASQISDRELQEERWTAVREALELNEPANENDNTLALIGELRKLALIDVLTGLPNRRFLEKTLRTKLDAMQRYDLSFGLLFIDIDDFKKINDSHGHDIGDEVLKTVSKTLFGNARSSDMLCRWGGEEFVALVVNVSEEELLQIAEKFRMLVEQLRVDTDKGDISVTVSIGASLAYPDDTEETLLKKVDRLMYKSKTGGKNRTTAAFSRQAPDSKS